MSARSILVTARPHGMQPLRALNAVDALEMRIALAVRTDVGDLRVTVEEAEERPRAAERRR